MGIVAFFSRELTAPAIQPHFRQIDSGQARPGITVPVEFLLQWDDEAVPRDWGLALFGAFASREKTLHANPGRHAAYPRSNWRAQSVSSPVTSSKVALSRRLPS